MLSRTRPKIAHVLTNAWDGGIEKVVFDLVTGCLPGEADFQVHALIGNNPGAPRFRDAGIPFFSYHAMNKPASSHWVSNLRAMMMLSVALRKERVDLVQVHDFFPGVLGRFAGMLAGTPIMVATLHNTYSWLKPRHGFVNRILSLRTSLVVGVSHACVQDSRQRDGLPSSKYKVIHNGVDPTIFHPDQDQRRQVRGMLGFSDRDIVVGNIGTISSRKGQSVLLRAVRRLVGKHPSLKVVIIGSKREHEMEVARELMELAGSPDLDSRITFLEARTDVASLLNAFDLFVMPSRQEGFGIALVEAMLTEIPCVVSDIPAFREVAEGSKSFLFHPVDDEATLATQINLLVSSPELRESLSRNARSSALAHFSKESMLEQWNETYRHILRVRTPRR